jgi:hypothetical protein
MNKDRIERKSDKREFRFYSRSGNIYIVVISDSFCFCDCKGFEYRESCRHVDFLKDFIKIWGG